MKHSNSILEFILGLIGVLIHSVIVIFMLSAIAYPEILTVMIDASSGFEKEMLLSFASDVALVHPIIYVGTAIVVFEWIAIFKILKEENKLTPVWSAFLLLGSFYAYFYFGGLEVFVLLLIPALMTFYKYFKHRTVKDIDEV